jgi:hypothetical protein
MAVVPEAQPPIQVATRQLLAHPHIRARVLALAIARTPFRATADLLVHDAFARLFDGRAAWDPAGGGDLVEHLGGVVNALAWDATHGSGTEEGYAGLLDELRRRLRARNDELSLKIVGLVEGGADDRADQAKALDAATDAVALAHRRIARHVRAIIQGDRESGEHREGEP